MWCTKNSTDKHILLNNESCNVPCITPDCLFVNERADRACQVTALVFTHTTSLISSSTFHTGDTVTGQDRVGWQMFIQLGTYPRYTLCGRACVYKRAQLHCFGHISNMPARIKGPFFTPESKASLCALSIIDKAYTAKNNKMK